MASKKMGSSAESTEKMLTYGCKVYLTKESALNDSYRSNPLIRRMLIKYKTLTYDILSKALQNAYPELHDQNFTITWKDYETDYVIISTDNELQIAIEEIGLSGLKNLYVTLHDKPVSSPSAEVKKESYSSNNSTINDNATYTPPPTADASETGKRHPGVVCDSCEKSVCGFRYKCLQCPNYDLCSDCEARGQHAKHYMIRIPQPLQGRSHREKRFFYLINKLMRKGQMVSEDLDDDIKECPFKSGRRCGAGRHCDSTSTWFDAFNVYLNDWVGYSPTGNTKNKDQTAEKSVPKPEPSRANVEYERKNANASASGNPENSHVDFLKTVGETISQFLDPLGIDVNVQVKTDKFSEPSSTATFTRPASPAPVRARTPENSTVAPVPNQSKNDTTSQSNDKIPAPEKPLTNFNPELAFAYQSAIPSQSRTQSNGNQTKENSPFLNDLTNLKIDDWTLLDTDIIPNTFATTPVVSSTTNADELLTPLLPPKQSNPTANDVIWHSNPKIHQAIKTMMEMGFNNIDGWLTNLLVLKDGDISQALDVLQLAHQ